MVRIIATHMAESVAMEPPHQSRAEVQGEQVVSFSVAEADAFRAGLYVVGKDFVELQCLLPGRNVSVGFMIAALAPVLTDC